MKQLHPRAVWLFFLNNFLRWFLLFLVILFYGSFLVSELRENDSFKDINVLTPQSFLYIFIFLIVLYIWARLSYHFYRYELTDDGFRKELGVIWKKYVTIPYDRIQNVDIYRGPLARLLGLSDLNIQTAGMSYVGKYGAATEGRLPGLSIEEAENLRNELISRIDKSHQGGL